MSNTPIQEVIKAKYKCPKCRYEINIDDFECAHCKLQMNMINRFRSKSLYRKDSMVLENLNTRDYPKDRKKAAFLAIFLGTFGIHKFYLEKVSFGIIYFIMCWSFLPSMLGILEGVIYLRMTDKEFNEKYYNP